MVAGSQVVAQCPAPTWTSVNPGVPGLANHVWALTPWHPDGPGPAPPVLVAGGNFTFAGSGPANHVASWDGASWQPLSTGINGYVFALSPYNGELVAGGVFGGG